MSRIAIALLAALSVLATIQGASADFVYMGTPKSEFASIMMPQLASGDRVRTTDTRSNSIQPGHRWAGGIGSRQP